MQRKNTKENCRSGVTLTSNKECAFVLRQVSPDLHKEQRGGFTLIELLVVVLIIGILAAVAVPQYQVAVDKAEFVSALPTIKALSNAEEMFYLANGKYGNFTEIEIPSNCGVSSETVLECKINGQNARVTLAIDYVFDIPLLKSKAHIQVFPQNYLYPASSNVKRCGGGSSTRIERLCKALGAIESTKSTNSNGSIYWNIQFP